MKRRIGYGLATAFICAMGALSPAVADDVPVQSGYATEKPLMVIRFNQPHIIYERSLYNTISEALQVKSSATFEILSVAAKARDAGTQEHYDQVASQNTQKVLATLSEMGLPQNRYTVKNTTDNVSASEVRIFVH